jgi:hypothetical protein
MSKEDEFFGLVRSGGGFRVGFWGRYFMVRALVSKNVGKFRGCLQIHFCPKNEGTNLWKTRPICTFAHTL